MREVIDLTGKRFGRWTVLSRDRTAPSGQARWHCRCACGELGTLVSQNLRTGHSTSCGCWRREVTILLKTKHGHATKGISSTYHSWAGMCPVQRSEARSLSRVRRQGDEGLPSFGAISPGSSRTWAFDLRAHACDSRTRIKIISPATATGAKEEIESRPEGGSPVRDRR